MLRKKSSKCFGSELHVITTQYLDNPDDEGTLFVQQEVDVITENMKYLYCY